MTPVQASLDSAYALWFATMAVEILLLGRGLQVRLFRIYPVFYCYVLFVLVQSVVRLWVYRWHESWYAQVYWYGEFVGVLAGCGVLFEIYWRGLAPYPGTARLARNVLALVLVFASGKAVVGAGRGRLWWPAQTTGELERTLRAVQACAILALVILLLAYSIPLGRNLRGIVLGYGLFIATRLVSLTAVTYLGRSIEQLWRHSQQVFYLLVLCIWTVALWRPSSQPGSGAGPEGVPSYKAVEKKTRERLKRARIDFGKGEDR